jgi:hypothetical protein
MPPFFCSTAIGGLRMSDELTDIGRLFRAKLEQAAR